MEKKDLTVSWEELRNRGLIGRINDELLSSEGLMFPRNLNNISDGLVVRNSSWRLPGHYENLVSLISNLTNPVTYERFDDDAKKNVVISVRHAIAFLTIIPRDIELPRFTYNIDGDGELYFTWRQDGKKADIEFGGNEGNSYTYHSNGKYIPGEHKLNLNEVPKDLLVYLRS